MRVVVGQGSCGIATGAKKTAAEFEKQLAEKNLNINVILQVVQVHVTQNQSQMYMMTTGK